MTWLAACKEYATRTGKWIVPKKDSAEYTEIKKIQEKMLKEPKVVKEVAKEPKKAPAKPKAPVVEPKPMVVDDGSHVEPSVPTTAKAPRKKRVQKSASMVEGSRTVDFV